jgi:hypothetical protein
MCKDVVIGSSFISSLSWNSALLYCVIFYPSTSHPFLDEQSIAQKAIPCLSAFLTHWQSYHDNQAFCFLQPMISSRKSTTPVPIPSLLYHQLFPSRPAIEHRLTEFGSSIRKHRGAETLNGLLSIFVRDYAAVGRVEGHYDLVSLGGKKEEKKRRKSVHSPWSLAGSMLFSGTSL